MAELPTTELDQESLLIQGEDPLRCTGPDAPAAVMPEFVLSYNQEFFCMLDEGDSRGAFSDRHTLVGGWRLAGPVDVPTLQAALDDVVARHEILRTSIARQARPRYQVVHPPSTVRLQVRELPESPGTSRELRCEQLMAEIEAEPFAVSDLPLLRAVLGRFDEQDAVLVLTVHHIATDAWSMQLLIRDVLTCYARRRGFPVSLPEVHQYREYCRDQRIEADSELVRQAQDYWRAALRGARAFELPVAPPPEPPARGGYAMHNFAIAGELVGAIGRLAGDTRSSPFMVLLSAFYLLAHRLTGYTDLVVPPFTTGRNDSRFYDTVGTFMNFLPVRTDIAGCRSFREVLTRTRASCLEAYSHDIPFALIEPVAPELLHSDAPTGRTPVAFEMVQAPAQAASELVGDLAYAEVHTRLLADGDCPDLPNGTLWALNLVSPRELIGTVQFSRAEFELGAIVMLVEDFREVLAQSVDAPDAPLRPAP
jgi:hypothetical protein